MLLSTCLRPVAAAGATAFAVATLVGSPALAAVRNDGAEQSRSEQADETAREDREDRSRRRAQRERREGGERDQPRATVPKADAKAKGKAKAEAEAEAEAEGESDGEGVRTGNRAGAQAGRRERRERDRRQRQHGEGRAQALRGVDLSVIVVPLQRLCDQLAAGNAPAIAAAAAERPRVELGGPALPAPGTTAYSVLLAQLQGVASRYPEAAVVSAVYDGRALVITVLPDVADCPGQAGLAVGAPATPAEEQVTVVQISEEQICETIAQVPAGESRPGTVDDFDDYVAELFDVRPRTGDQISGAERASLRDLTDELDQVVARYSGFDIIAVDFDAGTSTAAVFLEPSEVDCAEGPAPAPSEPTPPSDPPTQPPTRPVSFRVQPPALAPTGLAHGEHLAALAALAGLAGTALLLWPERRPSGRAG